MPSTSKLGAGRFFNITLRYAYARAHPEASSSSPSSSSVRIFLYSICCFIQHVSTFRLASLAVYLHDSTHRGSISPLRIKLVDRRTRNSPSLPRRAGSFDGVVGESGSHATSKLLRRSDVLSSRSAPLIAPYSHDPDLSPREMLLASSRSRLWEGSRPKFAKNSRALPNCSRISRALRPSGCVSALAASASIGSPCAFIPGGGGGGTRGGSLLFSRGMAGLFFILSVVVVRSRRESTRLSAAGQSVGRILRAEVPARGRTRQPWCVLCLEFSFRRPLVDDIAGERDGAALASTPRARFPASTELGLFAASLARPSFAVRKRMAGWTTRPPR